jgi:hypothetical protein
MTTYRQLWRLVPLIILFVLGMHSHSVAQDNLKAQCSFDEFPLGALRYGNLDTLEKMIGANCGWSFYHNDSVKLATMGAPDTLKTTVTDPFYYRTDTTVQITDASGNFPLYLIHSACSAHDRRVYLPGTDSRDREYNSNVVWSNATGRRGNLFDGNNTDTAQWLIHDTDAIGGTDYVLKDLTREAQTDPYYGGGHFEEFLDSNHVGLASYEFVCYIDSPLLGFPLSHSLPLYQIEYWVKPQFSSTWQLADSIPITYDSYIAAPYGETSPMGKRQLADSIGTWQEKTPSNRRYHVFHNTIDVRPFYNNIFNWYQPGDADNLKVDIRLKTFHQWPIYVRMLRIRDWRATRLFSGAATPALASIITKLKNHTVGGIQNNMTMRSWYFFDEPHPEAFHSIGFMNEMLDSLGARPLTCLAPYEYDRFARIFRAETKSEPGGIFWNDWYPWYGAGWRAADRHSDSSVTPRLSNFYGANASPPVQSDVVPDSADMARRGVPVISNYNAFTDSTQGFFLGYATDDGGTGWTGDLTRIAKSTTAVDPQQPFKFCMMGQAYVKPIQMRTWWVDSLITALFPGDSMGLRRRLVGDSLQYLKVILPYLNRRAALGKCDSLSQDSISDGLWFYRAPTRSEMLYEGWAAAVAGLKGYTVSNAFSDGIHQIGFVKDSETVHDIKSKDFWNVRLGIYRWDDGGQPAWSYLEPWSRDSALKTHTYVSRTDGLTYSYEYRYTDNFHDSKRPCLSEWGDQAAFDNNITYCMVNRSDANLLPNDPTNALFYRSGALGAADWHTGLVTYHPLPAAFGGMFDGVKTVIGEQLNPVGRILGKLQYRGTVSWHKKTMAPVALSKLPIDSIVTKSLNISPFNGSIDSNDHRFVDVSFHRHAVDSEAAYIIIQNRRLWLDTTTSGALGKIDWRTVSFKVKPSVFGPKYATNKMWLITDSALKKDSVIGTDGYYSITLRPGEGRVLRIAPAQGLTLGRTDYVLYNNARHITPIETDSSVSRYLATYIRGGNVIVSYPVENSETVKRNPDTPSDSTIDGSGSCFTPAICWNKLSNTIGLTYATWKPDISGGGTIHDTFFVWLRHAKATSPYHFSARKVLDTIIYLQAADTAFEPTPSIIATDDTVHSFWVAWRAELANGGCLAMTDTFDNVNRSVYFHAGSPSDVRFPSLGSHYISSNQGRLAWEEYATLQTHIYSMRVSYDAGNNWITPGGIMNISKPFGYCTNKHPQISTIGSGTDQIVWETKGSLRIAWPWPGQPVYLYAQTTAYGRFGQNWWGDFRQFFPISPTVYFTYAEIPNYTLWPNVSATDGVNFSNRQNLWNDFTRIAWNNYTTGHIEMVHTNLPTIGPVQQWAGAILQDGSYEPALPTTYRNWLDVPDAMLYKGNIQYPDGWYDAKMTRFNFPVTPVTAYDTIGLVWKELKVRTATGCLQSVIGGLGNGTAIHAGTPTTVTLMDKNMNVAAAAADSLAPGVPSPTTYNDNRTRTNSFAMHPLDTLKYFRYFALSEDESSVDTTALKAALIDSSDYIKTKVCLRKHSDSTLIAVLDSAMFKKAGLTQTGSDLTLGEWIPPLGFASDSVFITMEMSKGNMLNTMSISLVDMYANSDITYGMSFKRSAPQNKERPSPRGSNISISIVPNPFQLMATVAVDMEKGAPFTIALYDLLGRKITDVATGVADQTHYEFFIGNGLSEGVYLLRVQSGNDVETRKVELIK